MADQDVTQQLEIVGMEALKTLVDEVKKYVKANESIYKYHSTTEVLPSVGKENVLYVDADTNTLYRWDDDDIKYYNVSFDPSNIKVISCGSSTE